MKKYPSKLTFVIQKLFLDHGCKPLDALIILRSMEKDEERQAFFSELFGIFERDFSHQRSTLVSSPDAKFVVAAKKGGYLVITHANFVSIEGHTSTDFQ